MTIADHDELRQPPYGAARGVAWLLAEAWDHLWPWAGRGQGAHRLIQGSGLLMALAATMVWVLTALGYLSAMAVIGWWFAWSVVEVRVRLDGKAYVKEGPWWGRLYRRASTMDMICYVAFKNLLIGAALFLTLKALGLLQV